MNFALDYAVFMVKVRVNKKPQQPCLQRGHIPVMHDACLGLNDGWWVCFFLLLEDQIIWTDPGEWKWVREGQTLVPCFSLTSNVIRALNEGYGLDSNPQLSLIPLHHLSVTDSSSFPSMPPSLSLTPSFPAAADRYCFISPSISLIFKYFFFMCVTTVMAAAVHSCRHVKSNDVTSAGIWTSVPVAVLHLFYLIGCNEWSSAPAFLLHISNRPWVFSPMS